MTVAFVVYTHYHLAGKGSAYHQQMFVVEMFTEEMQLKVSRSCQLNWGIVGYTLFQLPLSYQPSQLLILLVHIGGHFGRLATSASILLIRPLESD